MLSIPVVHFSASGIRRSPGRRFLAGLVLLAIPAAVIAASPATGARTARQPVPTAAALPNPILFVTQVPLPADFATVVAVFGNQVPDSDVAPRGGDLYALYPNGHLRNLTREAGFGVDGFQGAKAIAVRDPSVHWSATKALFSMVVGAPVQQFTRVSTHWQLYEVSGLAEGQPVSIHKVPQQPAQYNNVAPLYTPDGRIVFASDRPRGGEAHLYPQLDEYEEQPTVTGLWSLDPASGDLRLLDHVPSGAFTPILDSAGRVVYTRWDHLQRDQQADSDATEGAGYGTFNYLSEAPDAARLQSREEVYPEPRSSRTDLLAGTNLEGHEFNQFFPWAVNPDGTELETLNHVGRHELSGYFDRSLNDDDGLVEFIADQSGRFNPDRLNQDSLLQIREDPLHAGRFVGTSAPEFRTHAAGGIAALNLPDGLPADQMRLDYLTHPATSDVTEEGATPAAGSTGHYRDPLPLSDGGLIAAHTLETRADMNLGDRQNPRSRYAFRLKRLQAGTGGYLEAGTPLTAGISKAVSYFDPDQKVSYSGELWELQPVEVRARPQPPLRAAVLPAPEAAVFAQEGVDVNAFRNVLRNAGLALAVSRNVTTRDVADRQQPFNLQVAGGGALTRGDNGKLYAVSHLQFFQGDLLRGLGGAADPNPGRRVLAEPMHGLPFANPSSGGPPGSVRVASDGSVAAFVPARRALSWQLLNQTGSSATPVVRERYWLTMQPGEVRVCTSCHGPNSHDQAGDPAPTNSPQALHDLLRSWKSQATCTSGGSVLCLRGRFKVEVEWQDFAAHLGSGHGVSLTSDTGYFWFFDPANVELMVKVVDGRGLNGEYWVFFGALSNVSYRLNVTDLQTGNVKSYSNLGGTFASVGDTGALPGVASALLEQAPPLALAAPMIPPAALATAAPTCTPGPSALCLQGGRFRAEVSWKDFSGHTGTGHATAISADTGDFWFFNAANLELVVKVLDGRGSNGKFWVFYGALSNVEYTLTVTDTTNGARRTYHNPSRHFGSAGDTAAF